MRPRPHLGLATPRMNVVAPTNWARLFPLFCKRGSTWLDSPSSLGAPGRDRDITAHGPGRKAGQEPTRVSSGKEGPTEIYGHSRPPVH